MAARILFDQELELLKNQVTEMSERAEISYDRLVYAVKKGERNVLEQLLAFWEHILLDTVLVEVIVCWCLLCSALLLEHWYTFL